MIDWLLIILASCLGVIGIYTGIRLFSKAVFRSYFESKMEWLKNKPNSDKED